MENSTTSISPYNEYEFMHTIASSYHNIIAVVITILLNGIIIVGNSSTISTIYMMPLHTEVLVSIWYHNII